jgi:hypothetical protein
LPCRYNVCESCIHKLLPDSLAASATYGQYYDFSYREVNPEHAVC